jgi:hypothetical protein
MLAPPLRRPCSLLLGGQQSHVCLDRANLDQRQADLICRPKVKQAVRKVKQAASIPEQIKQWDLRLLIIDVA